jgi:hypothetical protein
MPNKNVKKFKRGMSYTELVNQLDHFFRWIESTFKLAFGLHTKMRSKSHPVD